MKKMIVFLILIFAFAFSQENSIPVKEWKTAAGTSVSSGSIEGGLTISSLTAQSVYSNEIEIYDNKYPGFDQEITVVIKADTMSGLGDDPATELDSITFYPMYHLGKSYGWFTGSAMTLFAVSGDKAPDSTESTIILPANTGLTFLWKTVPADTALGDTAFVQNVEWDLFKLKGTIAGDSTYFNLAADIIIRETK